MVLSIFSILATLNGSGETLSLEKQPNNWCDVRTVATGKKIFKAIFISWKCFQKNSGGHEEIAHNGKGKAIMVAVP